ncbi:hypothetical protein OVS_01940 [Mycoplasma ovis str. Michigan]|uniref:Uncharacterized protein n=1 Tax=Mycoplasma ovis str. Michigan TaxID=1415773 RepID=A0ABM5P1D9_9MOLU|nr:hypothetical protein OVS_01940 [Mycoplasma ovis str. Michigan]
MTGFFGLSTIAVSSFALANHNREVVPVFAVAPPDVIKQVSSPVTESIQELMKDGEYKGCSSLATREGKGSQLYVCLKTTNNDSYVPHFYFFNKKALSGKFPQVSQITNSKNSYSIDIQLAEGKNESLTYFPFWLRNISKNSLNPEADCQISKENSSYSLTCNSKKVQTGIQI